MYFTIEAQDKNGSYDLSGHVDTQEEAEAWLKEARAEYDAAGATEVELHIVQRGS